MANREFTIADEVHYNRRGPIRWIISHVLRYKGYLAIFIVGTILSQVLTAIIPNLIGSAFNEIVRPHPSIPALGTQVACRSAAFVRPPYASPKSRPTTSPP